MQTLAFKAYGEVQTRTASDREIEIALFEQITRALKDASAPNTPAAMRVEAISRNLSMWTLIAADILTDGNQLDASTKRSLILLAEFTRRRSMELLAGSDDLTDLMDINSSIVSGLTAGRKSTEAPGAD